MNYFNPDDVVQLALKLLLIRGESKNERDVADFVISFLKDLGLQPSEDEAGTLINGNAGNICCEVAFNSSASPYCFLNAHLDTVVPTHKASITVQDGRICTSNDFPAGIDNRAGIAIILSALKAVKQNGLNHENFYVIFTVGEDSGLQGSPHLRIPDQIETGFTFDASPRPGSFIASSSGSYEFTAEITGKKAHGGVSPEKGINAIQIASNAIAKLKLGWVDEQSTFNIGMIEGGNATNVVPDIVIIKGELRSTTKQNILSHLSRIEQFFRNETKHFGGSVKFRKKVSFSPYSHSEKHPSYQRLSHAIKKVGLEPRPIHYSGGSDANVFNEKGLPTLNIGIGAQNPHSSDEFIFIDDLIKSTEIAIELIKRN